MNRFRIGFNFNRGSSSTTELNRLARSLLMALLAVLLAAPWPLQAAEVATGSTKFIPTFLVYYGGGPAFVASDAPKLAKFDFIDIARYRYDNIGPNTWSAIKSINPGVQIYLYEMGPETPSHLDGTPQLYLNGLGRYDVSRGHFMGSLNGNHPELFLLNSSGSRVYNTVYSNVGANQYWHLMDFGSPAYQSYWLAAVKADIVDQPWAADGVFVDNCLTLAGGYSGTPAMYLSNAAWSGAMNSFAGAITAGMHGYGQKLWCNRGESRKAEGSAAWLALDGSASPPDVLLEPGAFATAFGSWAVQFFQESEWRRQVDTLGAIRNSKVAMMSHTRLSEGQTGTDNWGKPVNYWQTLWYSLGSFLLSKNDDLGNAYFMFNGGSGYDRIWWHDEFDHIDLGKSMGPYRVTTFGSENIYWREFERGYVYVNPTPNDVASVILPQASRQLTRGNMTLLLDSTPSVSTISMNGHHAAILLKTVTAPISDTTAPTVPTGLVGTAVSPSQINLSWNPSTDNVGVMGYYVYLNSAVLAITSATSYQHTGLTPDTTYIYRVSAFDAVPNHSAWTATPISVRSGALTTTTSAQVAASSGTPLAVPGTSAATLAPVSTPYSGVPSAVPGTIEAENFDLGGEGVAYHDRNRGNQGGLYRITEDVDLIASLDALGGGYVVNNFKTGEWLAYTINVAASALYDIEIRASSTSANSAFHIEIDGQDVTGRIIVPNTLRLNTFQWVGKKNISLTAGTHVLKIVSDQQYFNLNSIRVTSAPDTTAPSVPIGLVGSAVSSSQINLSWTAATDNVGVTGYNVYRGGTQIATLGAVTTFQNTGLTASTNYSYTVRAIDAAGNVSAPSSAASATTQAAAGGATATLEWDAVTAANLGGYRIYYGTAPGTYLQPVGQGLNVGNVTTYTVTGLNSATRYYFAVRAYDTSNKDGYNSNEVFKDIP